MRLMTLSKFKVPAFKLIFSKTAIGQFMGFLSKTYQCPVVFIIHGQVSSVACSSLNTMVQQQWQMLPIYIQNMEIVYCWIIVSTDIQYEITTGQGFLKKLSYLIELGNYVYKPCLITLTTMRLLITLSPGCKVHSCMYTDNFLW